MESSLTVWGEIWFEERQWACLGVGGAFPQIIYSCEVVVPAVLLVIKSEQMGCFIRNGSIPPVC